jgi:hypothetical protein
MRYIKKLVDFNESYLDSNFAPLYHFTDEYSFHNIVNENTLRVSRNDNILDGKVINIVSLTRDDRLNLEHYKMFTDVMIKLDRDKLNKKYKIVKYDFFVHSKKEDKPKSNPDRKEPFEFEEFIERDIENVLDYIISVDFRNGCIMDRNVASTIPTLRKRNITIYDDGKEY